MAEPLDYYNPKSHGERQADRVDELPPDSPGDRPAGLSAIVTETVDHAATSAIAAALRRERIDHFIQHDQRSVARQAAIFVAPADLPRAQQIASQLFARRQKLKSFPRQSVPQDASLRAIDRADLFLG